MNGEQLKRAREIRGLTQAELASDEGINVTQAAIARIEQNLLVPSEDLVGRLSKRLGFPVKFFDETTSFDFPQGSLLFRCLKDLRSKDRSQIVQTAWAGFKLFDLMSKGLKISPPRFPRIQDTGPEATTQILRSALGVEPDKPIRNLINKLEKIGVVIVSIPLEIHEHDGFSLWIQDCPVIVMSSGKPGDRQRRTAAHEAMHLTIHHTVSGDLDDIEKQADEYTNELLTPGDVIREEIRPPVTLSSLAELKPRWGVSIQSLIQRSGELGIISANQKKYLWKQINDNKWRINEPNTIEAERPRALQKMAELLYSENGRVNYSRLAAAASLPVDIVIGILKAYEGFRLDDVPPSNVVNFPHRKSDDQKTEEELEPARDNLRRLSNYGLK